MRSFIRRHALIAEVVFLTLVPSAVIASSGCAVGQQDAWGVCPTELKMARGSYGLIVDGAITPSHYAVTYALTVKADQTLTMSFAGAHEMTGEIRCGRDVDGPYSGTGNSFTVKQAHTCFISVGANTHANEPWTGGFTLALIIK